MPDSLRFLDLQSFKQKAQESPESILGLGLRKQFILEQVKAVEGEDRTLLFTISTGTIDRDQDTINPDGWKLENYLKNPVVLWAHDYGAPPVARALATWVENQRLMSRAQFASRDLYSFADMIYRMYLEGFLKATSVGFDPLKWSFSEDRKWGVDFLEQELLEFSCVPVPANAEALVGASAKGIDLAPLKEWAEKTLDGVNGEAGLWIPKAKVERAYQIVNGGKKAFTMAGAMEFLDDQLGHILAGGSGATKVEDNPDPESDPPAEGTPPAVPVVPEEEAAAGTPAGHKSGRVLSKKNEERLAQARDLIGEVLDQLAEEEEAEEPEPAETHEEAAGSASHKDTQPKGAQIIDLDAIEPTVELKTNLLDVDPETLKQTIKDAVAENLRALSGRVD